MDNKALELTKKAIEEAAQTGVFLVAGGNAMTLGWSMAGIMWTKQGFMAPVRTSRHTHTLLEQAGEFTICVPRTGEMKEALAVCGTKSGRDMDKIKTLNLSVIPGKAIATQRIAGCALYVECRILSKTDMDLNKTDKEVCASWYAGDSEHTLYFGEIIAAYEE